MLKSFWFYFYSVPVLLGIFSFYQLTLLPPRGSFKEALKHCNDVDNEIMLSEGTEQDYCIDNFMNGTMIKKAQDKALVNYKTLNLFDYTDYPHRNIDDYPFGGGEGMVMKPEPIFRAFDNISPKISSTNHRVIYPTPEGKRFNQEEANKLKEYDSLVFICGHYKGIDQRVRDNLITDEYSIGDYVITGGESVSYTHLRAHET